MRRIVLFMIIALALLPPAFASYVYEHRWGQLNATETNILVIPESDIAFRQINMNVKSSVSAVWITLTRNDAKPYTVAEKAGENVYQYIETETTNLYDHNIKNGTVVFDVNKNWFTNNNLDPETVALRWYDNYVWKTLDTRRTGDNTYEADIYGLAVFGIIAQNATVTTTNETATTTIETTTTTLFTTTSVTTTTLSETSGKTALLFVIIVLVVAALVFAVLIRKRSRKMP
ncbi:MAG: PGF-pre-PGF domain-containing protein [Candidatus Aenigmarchaeota archaeon]|nr:PGF-pre-PGF domain-containing protein [Candidatus Aenigmarchaeota archaeon]